MEQRVVIKFYFESNKSATITFKTIKTVYDDICLSRSKIFKWYSRFKNNCRESLKDDQKEGRPPTSNYDKNVKPVRFALSHNQRLSIKMLLEQLLENQSRKYPHYFTRSSWKKKSVYEVCSTFANGSTERTLGGSNQ